MGIVSGMTGFASVKFVSEIADIEMEAISRNSKYLDIRITGDLPSLEIEQIISKAIASSGIQRGAIKVVVHTKLKNVSYDISVNKKLLSGLKRSFRDLGLEVSSSLSFEDIASIPDLVRFFPKKSPKLLSSFSSAAQLLAERLKKQREKEGKAMAKLLVSLIADAVRKQKALSKRLSVLKRKGLLVVAQDTDGEKDIFEEVKRLDMVLGMLKTSLSEKRVKGRDLDFICQEALREANTILSKIKDAQITKTALSLKTAIDRMREIAQNIE